MDYIKNYTSAYNNTTEELETFIKDELQKGLNDYLSFDFIFDEISSKLNEKKNGYLKEIKNNRLNDVGHKFKEWKSKYKPEKALELVIKNELYQLYIETSQSNKLDINYVEFLILIANYNAAEFFNNHVHHRKVYIEVIYTAEKIDLFEFEKGKNNWEDSKEYKKIYYSIILKKEPHEVTSDEILWREHTSLFLEDEKEFLLSIYHNIRSNVNRVEFLKLIMIIRDVDFDVSLFLEGYQYKNKKLYKFSTDGIEYYSGDKLPFLKTLLKKIIPFKLDKIEKELNIIMTSIVQQNSKK